MKMIYLAFWLSVGSAYGIQADMGGSSTGGGSPTQAERYFGIHRPKNSEDKIASDETRMRTLFYLNGLRGIRELEKMFYGGGQPKNVTGEHLAKARKVLRDVYDQKNGKRFAIDPNLKDENGEPLAATNSPDGVFTINPGEYFTRIQMEYDVGVAQQFQAIIPVHEAFSQPEIQLEKDKDYTGSSNLFTLDPVATKWDNTSLTESASHIVQTSKGLWALHYRGLAFSGDDGISWTEVEEVKGLTKAGLISLAGDKNGDAIVGTWQNGVFRVARTEHGKFKLSSLGLGNHSVEKVALAPDGRIVVAEWGNRSNLKVKDGSEWIDIQNYPGEREEWRGNIQSLSFLSDGTFIAGTHGPYRGIYTGQLFGEKRLRIDGDSEVTAVKVDSQDRIWAAYRQRYAGRLVVSENNGETFAHTNNPINDVIQFMAANKKGFLVVMGRLGRTAFTLDGGKTWKPVSLPAQMEIGGMTLTDSGYLLISNSYDGVMRSRYPIDQL